MQGLAVLVAGCLCAAAAQAQVFKCQAAGGKTIYTDAPCAGAKVLDGQLLQGNTSQAPSQQERQRALQPDTQAPATANCPSDLDIKNIHTRLSAQVIHPKNRAALHHELAKASNCRAYGGTYSYEQRKRLEDVLRGEH
jgi:surface antigen